MMMVTCNDVSV